MQDALVGRLVDGRYRVRARIARGGMATVYQAFDERLGRDVALKVMHPDLADDADFVARFIAEARSAAALSRHRTIVTVFDQGTSDGVVWLALELVRGGTLRALLSQRGRVDPATALAIMEQVLTALAAAHDAGIVHRDVKPENVLLGEDGHVQVADFGLAHAVTAAPGATRGLTTRGLLLGTVAYLSPEQAVGAPATQRSDVYAAGIMLFELLTGHPPYDGDTDFVVVRRHVDEDVPPPSAEVPGLPRELDVLVAAATARDTSLRFADAGDFLAAVRRARRLVADPTRPTGPLAVAAASGVLVDSERSTVAGASAAAPSRDTNPIHRTTAALDPVTPTAAPGGDADEPLTPAPSDPYAVPAAPPRKRRRRGVRVMLVLALVAAMAGGAWWWVDGRMVATPGMVGMSVEEATQAAERLGLGVSVTGQDYSESIPVDAVLATEPEAGQPLAPGDTVALVVSLGPERYEVPSLAGSTREQAEAALADLTLVPGQVGEAYDEQVPEGQVVSQDPAPGTQVKREEAVSFVVSLGREPIGVPGVVGATRDEAVGAIEGAGLAAQVGEAYSGDVERGRVISQEPADGTLFRGDTVSVVVSLGPETVKVPDVEGMEAGEAIAELEALGLTVRRIELLPAGPNEVLRQAPRKNETVQVGSEVTIYVF